MQVNKLWRRPHIPNEIKPLTSLRGIAAILVILCHIPIPELILQHSPWIQVFFELGWIGVPIYFVLSGYLITYLAFQEQEKFGQISLKFFYIRRILRVWPIYAVFCGLGLWAWSIPSIREIAASPSYLLPFLTFTVNIAMTKNIGQIGVLGAFWTLALDEQFYVFWGLSLKYFTRKKLFKISLIVWFLCILWRIFPLPFTSFINYRIQLPVSLATIMLGCLLTFIMPTLQRNKKIVEPLCLWSMVASILVLILIEWPFPHDAWGCFKLMGIADFIAFTLIVLGCSSENILTRILNKKIFYFIGDISLASYVTNLIVIYFFYRWCSISELFPTSLIGVWSAFLLNILLTYLIVFIVSFLWHRLDNPILQARRFFRVQSTQQASNPVATLREQIIAEVGIK